MPFEQDSVFFPRRILQRLAAAALLILAVLALLAIEVVLHPRWENLCADRNGCLFYRDNITFTSLLGLFSISTAAASLCGAVAAWRGSRWAYVFGLATLAVLGIAYGLLYLFSQAMRN